MAGTRSCLLPMTDIIISSSSLRSSVLKKYFAERRQGLCENSSNKYINISKYREECQMSLEISRVCFSNSWQCWSNSCALTTSAFLFWPFDFHACNWPYSLCVCPFHCYRAFSPVASRVSHGGRGQCSSLQIIFLNNYVVIAHRELHQRNAQSLLIQVLKVYLQRVSLQVHHIQGEEDARFKNQLPLERRYLLGSSVCNTSIVDVN